MQACPDFVIDGMFPSAKMLIKRSGANKNNREKALVRDNYTCVKCGATEYLHVHHKYHTGGLVSDAVEDLITLCNDCHNEEHC